MQYFPDNKTSSFVTKLSRTLQLDEEWEVGLAEIDYPHTWYNIREGKNLRKFTFQISGTRIQYSTWILRESDRCDRQIAQSWTS